MQYYILYVVGDVEPEIRSPFGLERERDLEARRLRQEEDAEGENGIFPLDVDESGAPSVGAYSGGFMQGIPGFDPYSPEADPPGREGA